MNDIEFRTPLNSKEFKEYDLFRWKILRKPIGKEIDSLKDQYEEHLIDQLHFAHSQTKHLLRSWCCLFSRHSLRHFLNYP